VAAWRWPLARARMRGDVRHPRAAGPDPLGRTALHAARRPTSPRGGRSNFRAPHEPTGGVRRCS
jgi:hypothetical protein